VNTARPVIAGLKPREYVIEEYTRTVCPSCFTERIRRADEPLVFKDGMLVTHDGSVWLRRFCAQHGETESLYEEDAEIWRARKGWAAPTLSVTPDRSGNYLGFPEGYRHGLPASHGQHTCILLLNVTERCNYGCTTCYASARSPGTPAPPRERPTVDEILHTVKTVIAREGGKLGVLMLSGGEPTIRQDLPDILLRLFDLNITRIMINTNGRRIARDDRFLDFLREHRRRIEIYLQFDGLRPETYLALRSEDVAQEKLAALRRLDEAGVSTKTRWGALSAWDSPRRGARGSPYSPCSVPAGSRATTLGAAPRRPASSACSGTKRGELCGGRTSSRFPVPTGIAVTLPISSGPRTGRGVLSRSSSAKRSSGGGSASSRTPSRSTRWARRWPRC